MRIADPNHSPAVWPAALAGVVAGLLVLVGIALALDRWGVPLSSPVPIGTKWTLRAGLQP